MIDEYSTKKNSSPTNSRRRIFSSPRRILNFIILFFCETQFFIKFLDCLICLRKVFLIYFLKNSSTKENSSPAKKILKILVEYSTSRSRDFVDHSPANSSPFVPYGLTWFYANAVLFCKSNILCLIQGILGEIIHWQ